MGFPRWGFSYGWRHSVFDYLLLLRGRSYKKGGRQSAVSRQKESGFGDQESGFGDPSYKKGGQQSVVGGQESGFGDPSYRRGSLSRCWH